MPEKIEKEYDYALVFNTLRIHANPVIAQAETCILLDMKFALKGNPFCDVTSSSYEIYRREVCDKMLSNNIQIISDMQELLALIKGKKVVSDFIPGVYEEKSIAHLSSYCDLTLIEDTNYILSSNEVNLLGKFSFSKFRKYFENKIKNILWDFVEIEALRDFDQYLTSGKAFDYFETRNALLGEHFSTRLSHLLNLGIIHPKDIILRVQETEKKERSNKSTYWIKFELLWREYFYWLYKINGTVFFKQQGFNNFDSPLKTISSQDYIEKMDKNPLIKAMNKELVQTGFLSNRSRQIYASFLINCTDLDWRYGAWFFQLHLKDYDLYSNWGNWLYLSGFGTDSKGPRFFNIVKQMKNYDPELSYLKKWGEWTAKSWQEIDNSKD